MSPADEHRHGVNPPTRLLRSWERLTFGNRVISFIDEILRGFSQVMFQNSPITGLLFMIGAFAGGWHFGLYALLGTAASTLAAHWLGVPTAAIRAGLYGYNGTLVGVGLAFYLAETPILPIWVIFAGGVVAIVSAAMGNFLNTWQVPALTGPFVVTTGLFVLGVNGFQPGEAGASTSTAAQPSLVVATRAEIVGWDAWEGILHGVAQVFLQDTVWSGALFLLGLLVSSRTDFVMAIAGSAAGLIVGWVVGVAADALVLGLMGYNAVLTMIALGGLFYVLDVNSVVLAIIAAATSVVVTIAFTTAVSPFGGHIYTAPFVVTTWAFIAAKPYLHALHAVPPADVTTPEANLNLYRRGGHWWERTAAT